MASSNTKPTKKPPDLATLQHSLTRLSTAAHLLDGFVHRNKNQHRGTRWWAPFDMLRRSVRKLLPDLDGAVQRAELLSSSSSSSAAAPAKRRKTNDKGGAAAAKQPELERVEARAQWVHDVVAVKAFEAFTQLLADRQFAQLGLMLIGVLAQVETSLAPFVRPAEPPEGDDIDEKPGPDPARAAVARMAAGRAGGGPVASQVGGRAGSSLVAGHEDDLGVAISRDELSDDDHEGEDEDVASSRPRRLSPPAGQPPPKEKRPEKGESKGKKRPRADDAGSSRIGKPEKPPRPESSRDEKKAKKKKKKKGGDEFDDLFSSLV
ncbi:hypothetical protein SLS64_013596 [Diaporthe eres]